MWQESLSEEVKSPHPCTLSDQWEDCENNKLTVRDANALPAVGSPTNKWSRFSHITYTWHSKDQITLQDHKQATKSPNFEPPDSKNNLHLSPGSVLILLYFNLKQ